MFEVKLICEGASDVPIVEAILSTHLPDGFILNTLQPEASLYGGDAGPHGGGWKGVRGWCEAVALAGGLDVLLPAAGLIVIHVDADIANDLGVEEPCPPPLETVTKVGLEILKWLGLEQLPPRVVLCIPSKATEAWLLGTLNVAVGPFNQGSTSNTCLECLPDPARALLQKKPKFVRMKGGKLKKVTTFYQGYKTAFASAWSGLLVHCASALWFEEQLRQFFTPAKPK